jgi:hypothetical protein
VHAASEHQAANSDGVVPPVGGSQGSGAEVDRVHLAVHGNGREPVAVEHSDQLAEIVAELASVRKEIGRT